MPIVFFLVVTLIMGATSHKAQAATPTKMKGTALTLYLGGDLGINMTRSQNTDYEAHKTGYTAGLKALLSLYVEKMMLEAGGGWFTNELSGGPARYVHPDGWIDHEKVSTKAGFMELSARYRATPFVTIGPMGYMTLGTDTSFAPYAAPKKEQVFAGFVVAKGTPDEAGALRYGLQTLTDLTIPDRQVIIANVFAQWAIPIVKPAYQVRERKVTKTEIKTVEKLVNRFFFALNAQVVNFKYNEAELLPESRRYLESLGRYLAGEGNSEWESLEVQGHTDSRGAADYNLKLSQARAESVKNVLVEQGILESKITAKGFGSTKPILRGDDDFSRAKNRRVEIVFEGVKDVAKLSQGLDRAATKQNEAQSTSSPEAP